MHLIERKHSFFLLFDILPFISMHLEIIADFGPTSARRTRDIGLYGVCFVGINILIWLCDPNFVKMIFRKCSFTSYHSIIVRVFRFG